MTKVPGQQTLTIQQALDLGVSYHNAGRFAEAESVYQQLLQADPNQPVALRLLGTIAHQLGNSDAAVDLITKAVAINPDDAEAHSNLGLALRELGQLDAAVASCRRALAIIPDLAPAHFVMSVALLMQGKLQEGWQEYEWGLKVEQGKRAPNLPAKIWTGSPLQGKSIIVCGEQGVGDEIMFASCIDDLLERSPDRLLLDCDLRLEALFARSFPGVLVRGRAKGMDISWPSKQALPDYALPIGSLPKFFRNRVEDFPERQAYLTPHPQLVEKWMGRLSSLKSGLKIGISWRGGTEPNEIKRASIALPEWRSLLSMDASFINLQYGDVAEDIAAIDDLLLHDWPDNDPLADLDNQAALISCLDLVVTIDNATVHLAGALGVRTWALIEQVPDWRWPEVFGDYPPLYRSVMLFRQKQMFEWGEVMERAAQALNDLMDNRS
jgi:tetratricopeptide (TPR) repeat protein